MCTEFFPQDLFKFLIAHIFQVVEIPIVMFRSNQIIGRSNQGGHHQRDIHVFPEFTFALAFMNKAANDLLVGLFHLQDQLGGCSRGVQHLLTRQDAVKALLLHHLFDIIINQQIHFSSAVCPGFSTMPSSFTFMDSPR